MSDHSQFNKQYFFLCGPFEDHKNNSKGKCNRMQQKAVNVSWYSLLFMKKVYYNC